ncbi:Acyl-CoA dehydrogenase [Micromonospora pallida]|uniref:Acyl-CoA dehydrogenase n=1 Tax=Micromonospora pallida TaxID=145854 RepID=A0A1C6RU34_9ACTN|nr:acyl-CoA dehydrogenase [Micromonospora pallida]SCL20731.1 Acyl-CoA dehydrogenase [Micromonospora pallida]
MAGDVRSAQRVAALEQQLGDPWDTANPTGFAAILAADEREEVFQAGEQALDRCGTAAELVPVASGGRLAGMDQLIRVTRPVCRRDLALWLGYGGGPFIATQNVWAAGDTDQRRTVADLVLGGGRIAAAYHELDHGSDFLRADLHARQVDSGLVLTGRKEIITNAARARYMVVFARTGAMLSPWSHSQLLVDMAAVPPDRVRHLDRFPAAGMRGVQLGGVEFLDCPVPSGSLLGAMGRGVSTALRSFQVTRVMLPAMATASLDTGLRVAQRLGVRRRLDGRLVADLPAWRQSLVDAFVDLLICDAFTTVAARGLHLLPGEASLHSAAVKYLVPGYLVGAMRRLSVLLGASFYLRTGPYAIFQKHLRDLPPALFGHAPRAACLAALLPKLPTLARRAWPSGEPAPGTLYELGTDVPELPYHQLSVSGNGRDSLSASLAAVCAALAGAGGEHQEVAALAAAFLAELRDLTPLCAGLAAEDLTPNARPAAFDLAARYATVLAASACLNVWWAAGGAGFAGDVHWIAAALRRLRRGVAQPAEPASEPSRYTSDPLWRELTSRFDGGQSFDLAAGPVAG